MGHINPGVGYTAPEDANYLIYYVSNSTKTPDAQITEGKDYPFFVGYAVNINLENNSQTLDLLEEGDRIRDVLSLQRAYLYSSDIQVKIDYRDKTVVIPEGTRVFYGGKRNRISNEGETLSFEGFEQTVLIYFNIENNAVDLTTIPPFGKIPDNVAVIGALHPYRPILNGFDEHLIEVNGEMFIPDHVKEYVEQHSPDPNIQKYFLLESIQGIYSKPNNVPDTSSDSEIPLESSNHQLVYDRFDSFTENDNRWTKTNLGEDTVGNPIYEYTYKPLTFDNNSRFTDKRLKIMILSSIHGYEQMAGWATTLFFEDLTSAKEEESALGFMARNVEFKVVPVGNPGGFDNNRRTNANGVDLNRNFDVNFNVSGTPSEGYSNEYYSGPYAESEVETQILSELVRNNTDADFFIDYHNIAGTGPMSYVRNDNQATMFSSLWRSLTHKWVKDYSLPERTHSFGHISNGGLGARLAVFAGSQGIEYALLETPWRISFASKKYDKITAETAIDSLGNLLTIFCKSVS